MRVYFIESDISIRWHRFDEQKQLIRWTVISVLMVYDQKDSLKAFTSKYKQVKLEHYSIAALLLNGDEKSY